MIIRRRLLRRLAVLSVAVFLLLRLLYLVLPSDSTVLLAIHFNSGRVVSAFRGSGPARDAWIWGRGEFPVDMATDVGLLIKTGYGTRARLPAQLDALGLGHKDAERFVVVGDFDQAPNSTTGAPHIHDAVGGLMRTNAVARMSDAPRFKKYEALRTAIGEGDESKARSIGTVVGWELDALKFIWGLDFAYHSLPAKKWYIILDDDTYMITPSMKLLLTHLDPTKPYYLGNAVGDFKGRFAHGGSAVVLSSATVKMLFDRPDVINQAHIISLKETWGDRLIATTLQKIGVYIDERFNHLFNGESPLATKLRPDRFCAPLVSFHELKDPEDMREVGDIFRDRQDAISWHQLWRIYDALEVKSFVKYPVRARHDYVGRIDEGTETYNAVGSAQKCLAKCLNRKRRCLAWTWDERTNQCHTSPWMVVGEPAKGMYSGINAEWAAKLMASCTK